jgi:hypothetical protein
MGSSNPLHCANHAYFFRCFKFVSLEQKNTPNRTSLMDKINLHQKGGVP